MTPGLYPNLSYEEAHTVKAVSFSHLKWAIPPEGSPGEYKYRLEHRDPPSDSMTFGSFVDHDLFTLSLPKTWLKVIPDGKSKRTNDGKAFCKAFPGDHIIDEETLQEYSERSKACVEAIHAHPFAAKILKGGRPAVWWIAELAGVPCKGKLDWEPSGNFLVDLKVTEPDEESFRHFLQRGHNYAQAAMYVDGYNEANKLVINTAAKQVLKTSFVFIVCQPDPPHRVETYELDRVDLEAGRKVYCKALASIQECEAKKEFPSSDGILKPISLSWWFRRDRLGLQTFYP